MQRETTKKRQRIQNSLHQTDRMQPASDSVGLMVQKQTDRFVSKPIGCMVAEVTSLSFMVN